MVEDRLVHAVEPQKIERLKAVIQDHLGHEIAFAVEQGKIATNGADKRGEIDLGFVERQLTAGITTGSMNAALVAFRAQLQGAMYETLMRAQVSPAQIGSAILVGGSSLMKIVADEVQGVCPTAKLRQSEAFTAVVDGLALASGKMVASRS